MATTPTNNFDFQNYYSGVLQADITSGSLTLSLDTVPVPVEGILVIDPDSATNREIVLYTGKTASTVTLPSDGRGWDSTTAVNHLQGTTVIMAPVAYMLRMLKSGSLFDTTKTGWTTLGTAPTFVQNNGQREQVLSTASDLTGVLSKGMKMKFDRPAGTPTQAMAFVAASSQYATKASPAGLIYTTTYTHEAWIYLNSYGAVNQGIISKYDGTNGATLFLQASTGQLGLNAGSATSQLSNQSIPLNKWTHVAGTFSSGTFTLYIDGVAVSMATKTGVATSITQAGSLQVGAYNSTAFFNGYISEARIWSVAQSQASILSNMALSLVGSETNLVALFQGNGNFNDKTSNANNLTASGGAIATQAANPYNSTEWGIITNVTSTQITLFTGSISTVPSTGTLANFYYSTSRSPYGFPANRDLWVVETCINTQLSIAVSSTSVWYNVVGAQISVPLGEWEPYYMHNSIYTTSVATSQFGGSSTLSTANNLEINPRLSKTTPATNASVTQCGGEVILTDGSITNAAQAIWYLNMKPAQISGASAAYIGATSIIGFRCPYL